MRTVDLRDVGPVAHLSIPIPEGGGCVVLRGRNGLGKSHALQAVSALLGGSARPVSRDQSPGALIEGLGARLTVGRRSSTSGELEVTGLDGEDPSRLVDPGIKGAEAADAERVRALLRLARAEVDLAAFAELVGDEARLRELCRPSSLEAKDGDVPAQASSIKRDLEAAARVREAAAANALAKAAGMRATVGELQDAERLQGRDAADARARHTAAVREHSAAEARRRQAAQTAEAASRARGALAALGGDGSAAAVDAATRAEREADERVEQLRAELARATSEHELAAVRLAQQQKAAKQRGQLQAAVDAANAAEPETAADLEALAAAVQSASAEVEAWAVRDRARGVIEEAERLEIQGTAASCEAASLRQAAQGTERVVLAAVRDVCGEGLELHEGRLYVHSDRGRELFADLSHGERWRIALDIAVKAVGTRGVLVCRQEAWESLDPDNRRAVSEYARALGVVLITAEAAEGELRAEVA